MRKKIPKRILTLLLAVLMIMQAVPVYALEANAGGDGDNVPGSSGESSVYNWGRDKHPFS